MTEEPQDHFKLDKRVPVVLIVTLALQTLGLAWFGGAMQQRLSHAETKIIELSVDARSSIIASTRIQAIETSLIEIKVDLRALRTEKK